MMMMMMIIMMMKVVMMMAMAHAFHRKVYRFLSTLKLLDYTTT